jgi:hypothetical protein
MRFEVSTPPRWMSFFLVLALSLGCFTETAVSADESSQRQNPEERHLQDFYIYITEHVV